MRTNVNEELCDVKVNRAKECRVYGLVDPITDQLRYIGATTAPEAREYEHLVSALGTVVEKTKLGSWVRKLKRFGQKPCLVWMENLPNEDLMHIAEEFWIAYYRESPEDDAVDGRPPADLLNALGGGPVVAKVCFVAPFNGYVAHDGRHWRLDAILKTATVDKMKVRCVGSVWGFDREPDEAEVFTKNGYEWLNTYVPSCVTPKAGGHPKIDLLLQYLTEGDAAGIRYLTHWLARKVQEPGRPNMTAIVLQGQQGTGKDTLALIVSEMIGRENCARIGQWNLETRFNAAFADKLLVIADEVVSKENVFDTASPLKQFITDETIRSEEKFAPNLEVKNRMSWIFTSNANAPVRIEGNDDRRFSIFNNMNAPPLDHRQLLSNLYGKDGLSNEFIKTEVAAFMFELIHLKVDEDLIRRPYENEARKLVAQASQNSVEAFASLLKDMGLEFAVQNVRGETYGKSEDFVEPEWQLREKQLTRLGRYWCDELYSLYRLFCTKGGFGPFNRAKFPGEMMKIFPRMKKIRGVGEKRESSCWQQEKVTRPWLYDGLPTEPVELEEKVEPIKALTTPASAKTTWAPPEVKASTARTSIDEDFERMMNE